MSESGVQVPFDALPTGGRVRPITRWGEPVMHRPTQPVVIFDGRLRELVADLVATMYAADGVGLAATQIGVSLAVFVFDCPDEADQQIQGVVCNPQLLEVSEPPDLVVEEEGCLSFPGAFVDCPGPGFARVSGQGLSGQPVEFSGRGLLARCLVHETDHLRGVVFGDKLTARSRRKLNQQHNKNAPAYPIDWPAHRHNDRPDDRHNDRHNDRPDDA